MKNEVQKLVNKYMIDRNYERGLKELSERTGIKYLRLQKHLQDPEAMRMFELLAMDDELDFTDEDLVFMIRAIRTIRNNKRRFYGGLCREA